MVHVLFILNNTPYRRIHKMKHKTIITIILSLILIAGLAQAQTNGTPQEKNINLGIVEMPQGEYETLKAMVAGKYTPRKNLAQPEPMENLGAVSIPRADIRTLRAMVSGTFTPSPYLWASQDVQDVNLGGVTMPQKEYEAMKAMVHPEKLQQILVKMRHHKEHSVQ
jgi:hypothetical protein